MNKSEYLAIKAARLKAQEPTRSMCVECLRPERACLCHTITPFSTQVHFRILMHPLEAKRDQVGTGRMTNRALQNCRIIKGVSFEHNEEVNAIIKDPTNQVLLLYPSSDSLNISENQLGTEKSKRLFIFIIDSTWACSNKMLRLSPNLLALPKISFTPNYLSRFDIKTQPKKYCLSTIESVYRLIQELKRQNIETIENEHEILPKSLERMVNFQLACAKERRLNEALQ